MIDDDDDDDVAINEISNNMKLPIYAVLVGRVSFLHTLIVVSGFLVGLLLFFYLDRWCFLVRVLLFFFSFWVRSMRTVQIKEKKENIPKNKNDEKKWKKKKCCFRCEGLLFVKTFSGGKRGLTEKRSCFLLLPPFSYPSSASHSPSSIFSPFTSLLFSLCKLCQRPDW